MTFNLICFFLIGLVLSSSAKISATDSAPLPEKPLVFVFQGDSITDGNRGRNSDLNHIMGHGYAYGVASRIGADFPTAGFKFFNRGISGNSIIDLQKRWQKDTLDLKPDVLSVLVGINDTSQVNFKNNPACALPNYEVVYRALLTAARAQNPQVLLVLGIPFVFRVGTREEKFDVWQTDVAQREVVVRKLAAEFNAVIVDYPALFRAAEKTAPITYWIWDGVHPTVFGHELMTRAWLKAVAERLPFLHKLVTP